MARRGRPPKSSVQLADTAEAKLNRYLEIYELDDLNEANDRTALKQLCDIEVQLDAMNKALKEMDLSDAETVRPYQILIGAQRDAHAAAAKIQEQLGIHRAKRKEDSEMSGATYIEDVRKRAANFFENRMVKLVCTNCNLLLGRYILHFPTEGGEPGSIAAITDPPRDTFFELKIKCHKCGQIVITRKLKNESKEDLR